MSVIGAAIESAPQNLVLDPQDPMRSARALVEVEFTNGDGLQTGHRWRRTWWLWSAVRIAKPETDFSTASTSPAWLFTAWTMKRALARVDSFEGRGRDNEAPVGDVTPQTSVSSAA